MAKLVGGAHMFRAFASDKDVGTRNIKEIKGILSERNIKIEGEDLGGTVGRSLTFDLLSGLVTITTKVS